LDHSNISTITSSMAPPGISTSMVWRPSFPNLHPQVNNYREPNLLLGNQTHCSGSRHLGSNYISSQEPNCKWSIFMSCGIESIWHSVVQCRTSISMRFQYYLYRRKTITMSLI
jgi:hypothetical protein